MQKQTIKITLKVEGIEIPISLLTYDEGKKYYISVGNSAKILTTYIKSKFPHLKIERSSDTFAGGDSITIYCPNATDEEYKQINAICDTFTDGDFDGMTDSYNYKKREDSLRFFYNDQELYVGAKYISVNRSAKWKPSKE